MYKVLVLIYVLFTAYMPEEALFCFIGNSDSLRHKNKHMFIEHMLDYEKSVRKKSYGYGELKDIEPFLTIIIVKLVVV